MNGGLEDVGKPLGIDEGDLKIIKKARRKNQLGQVLSRVLPILGVILGWLLANARYPFRQDASSGYPYIPAAVSSVSAGGGLAGARVPWLASIVTSAVAFVFTFLLIAWLHNFGHVAERPPVLYGASHAGHHRRHLRSSGRPTPRRLFL